MSHRAIRRSVAIASAIVLASVAPALAQADIEPARFSNGSIPQRMSPLAVGGGDVMLSVAVSASGAVGTVDVLRSTPPYTETVVQAVRTWRLSAALESRRK